MARQGESKGAAVEPTHYYEITTWVEYYGGRGADWRHYGWTLHQIGGNGQHDKFVRRAESPWGADSEDIDWNCEAAQRAEEDVLEWLAEHPEIVATRRIES